jgi:hypothetical protein
MTYRFLQNLTEYRISLLENRALRRIFGSKREEMARDWRRPHNEELHKLCPSQNVIRVIKSRGDWIGGACSTDGEMGVLTLGVKR